MDAGDPHVVNGEDFVAHHLGRHARLLRHRDVTGAGAHDGDLAFAADGPVAPDTNRVAQRKALGLADLLLDQLGRLLVRTGDEDVLRVLEQVGGDGNHLLGGLAHGENHFGHAVAQGAVVIDLGEAQVFKRHVAHLLQRRFHRDLAAAHFFQQFVYLFSSHLFLRISEPAS